MKLSDAAVLLAKMSAFDQRTIGEADAEAWAEALREVPLQDALDAVTVHYRRTNLRIMPSDVLTAYRNLQARRLLAAGTPPIPGDLSQQQERIWRRRWCELVKAGQSSADAASLVSGEMHLPEELPAVDRSTALRQLIQGSNGVTR